MEIDCICLCVVDAPKTRNLLVDRLGLQQLADRSTAHTIEYLVGNAHLLFSISSPLTAASPVADYLQIHPSGIKDVSFKVADLEEIRCRVDRLGVKILSGSTSQHDSQWLRIQGWGSIEHTILQATKSEKSLNPALTETIVGIDHIVLNVAAGELELAVNWYRELFGFQIQQTFDIHTQKSGLASKALLSPCGKIRFNINEPTVSNSQIQSFLDLNCGAGIQHIALQAADLFATIDRLQQRSIDFLPIPQTYYANLHNRARVEQHHLLTDREWHQLEHLQILMDWSAATPEQILLQIFTQPIFEAPTFFFEFIERRNRAKGFGQGNFQALFEAIEDYNSTTLSI
ncbi:4-hydroxyphenylpyruvate dioxygenase [Chamaesiphon sp. VAR_69_metabat_338]|uniref:4-hydroxyphenylpyruvate dioxygenase n=1 Tax=Chamaesiphon sp. VAR_69_metabat_338 TaxID=2964704 RepID=UPI00286E8C97|nr:4-hydroxyphenylpyruvate dioxygenase [Chamaesiphon sp. VAR_69_metabat_338]